MTLMRDTLTNTNADMPKQNFLLFFKKNFNLNGQVITLLKYKLFIFFFKINAVLIHRTKPKY